MRRITELDVNLVKEHQDVLHIYYGTVDGWVPVHRYENMRKKVPGVDTRLCDLSMEHGFVLDHSQKMADILTDWIENNRKLSNNNCSCNGSSDKGEHRANNSGDNNVTTTTCCN